MAKPNYQYEKRQKEMAKKLKQEEKRRQKLKDGGAAPDAGQDGPATPAEASLSSPDATPAAALPDGAIADGL